MGMGVARSLLRHGFEVHVCDLRKDAVKEVVTAGGHGHPSPAALAPHVDAVIVFVVNAAQTDAVLFGDHGAANTLKPRSVVICSTTVSPEFAADVAKRLAAKNLRMIDAPVSGGAAKANTGKMSVMGSGSDDAFAYCEKLFKAIAAAAEAMALGLRAGADPDRLYEIISNSAGNSWMFQNRVPHILEGDYTPLSAVNIFVKDLGIVLDYAKKSVFPLPLASTAHQMFMQASAAGHGGEDDAAVVKIFPGIDLLEPRRAKPAARRRR